MDEKIIAYLLAFRRLEAAFREVQKIRESCYKLINLLQDFPTRCPDPNVYRSYVMPGAEDFCMALLQYQAAHPIASKLWNELDPALREGLTKPRETAFN